MLGSSLLLGALLAEYIHPTQASLFTRSSNINVNATILGGSKVAMAWYAGWHSTDLPLSRVSWEKYTHMAYAFGVTSPKPTEITLTDSDEELLPQFVQAAHQHNVKATLSIGGWAGSRYFSTNVGSPQNRSAFVKTLVDVVQKYELDGLDFDWEYPNRQGIGCNTINNNDTANLLSFLQELRNDPVGAKMVLSTATSIQPWNDTNGTPSTDLSGFAKVFDFIAIMNYNIWGPSSAFAGPNAPLNDTCAAQNNRVGSAVSAVKAWSGAGIPLDKIVLGVPMFGQSFVVNKNDAFESGSSTTLALFPKFDAKAEHVGDKWDSEGGPDICGNVVGPSGTYSFSGLMDTGYLNTDGSVKDGLQFQFDNCSQTPYVYNEQTQTFISYDNADSFAAKGDFIKSTGLKGFAIWEAAGDYNDTLLNSIRMYFL
ncbi:glycoside hydrolase family 18 protein [Marasmius fiardii PR-910]|nr:glycoside hydrolase family 18 protein [Marasmius fiardii PR-910]